jgi:predicted ATPase
MHPTSLVYAGFWIAWIHHLLGENEEARKLAAETMDLAAAHGFPYMLEWGRIVLGSAVSALGQHAEGIDHMRVSLANQAALGLRVERPYCLTLLAEALLRHGELDEAEGCLAEALELAAQTEARSYEAESHRVLGELYQRSGSSRAGQAFVEFARAWEIARDAKCRALELRAAISYRRHALDSTEVETGCRMLAGTLASLDGQTASPLLATARAFLERAP